MSRSDANDWRLRGQSNTPRARRSDSRMSGSGPVRNSPSRESGNGTSPYPNMSQLSHDKASSKRTMTNNTDHSTEDGAETPTRHLDFSSDQPPYKSASSSEALWKRPSNRRRSHGPDRSHGRDYGKKPPGATFYSVANLAAGNPYLLVVQEGYEKNQANTIKGVMQSWGPPGGQRDDADRNRFVTGQREFEEETGFPWQAILEDSIVKCFTWYLVEGEGLAETGDRWVLLLPQPTGVVNDLMGLWKYIPRRNESKRLETLDMGWISFASILDAQIPRDATAVQPLLPIMNVIGKTIEGPLRPKYAQDTKQFCSIVLGRILRGTMSYCTTNKAVLLANASEGSQGIS